MYKNRPKTKAIVRECTCLFVQFPPQHAVTAVIYSLQDLGEFFLTNVTKPIYKVCIKKIMGSKVPFWQNGKIARMALLNLCMKFKIRTCPFFGCS